MEVHPEPGGVVRCEVLGEERADRSGEDIAGPAAGQRRVLERRDGDAAIRGGDHRLRALQDDDLAPGHGRVAGGDGPGGVVVGQIAVVRGIAAAARPEPGELAGMGSEDTRPPIAVPPALERREGAEGLGVEDDRRRASIVARRQEHPDELGGGKPRPQPGAHDDRVVIVVEDPGEGRLGIDLLDVVLGQPHRRRLDDLGREQGLERFGHGERDEPGPGPTRCAADEQGRARVVQRAREDEDLAEGAFVAALVPDRQQRRRDRVVEDLGAVDRRRRRLGTGVRGRIVADEAEPAAAGHRPIPSVESAATPSPGVAGPPSDVAVPSSFAAFASCSARSRSIRASSRRSRSSRRSSMSSGKT